MIENLADLRGNKNLNDSILDENVKQFLESKEQMVATYQTLIQAEENKMELFYTEIIEEI